VYLEVWVLSQREPPAGDVVLHDGGTNSYRLVVQQTWVQPTPATEELSTFITSDEGVSDRCESINVLKGIRRAAKKKMKKDAEKAAKGTGEMARHDDGVRASQEAESGW